MRARQLLTALLLLAASAALPGCGQPEAAAPAPSAPTTTSAPSAAPTAPPATQPQPAATASAPTAAANGPANARTLRLASPPLEGDDVRQLQQRLLELGYRQVGQADGIFGELTEAAVKTFQQLNQLTVDGIVGPQTLGRLGRPDATPGWDVMPIAAELCGEYLLLGATHGAAWVDSQAAGTLLSGGESYRLFSGISPLGAQIGSQPEQKKPFEPGLNDNFFVKFESAEISHDNIALGGQWDAMPRAVAVISDAAGLKPYEPAVMAFLRDKGIAQPLQPGQDSAEGRFFQVWKADLDGDGTEEALINANVRISESPDQTYSVILLQRGAQTLPVAVDILAKDKDTPFNWATYRLMSLMDVNGDTTLDLVIDTNYFESGAISVYQITNDTATPQISAWCGV